MTMTCDYVLNGKIDAHRVLEDETGLKFKNPMCIRAASGELPQWINLLIDNWEVVFGAPLMTYVSAIAAKAGETSWENRNNIIKEALNIEDGVYNRFVLGVVKILNSAGWNTRVQMGIPIPDDQYGTVIQVHPRCIEDIIIYSALLVRDRVRISALHNELIGDGERLMTGIFINYIDWNMIRVMYYVLDKDSGMHQRTRDLMVI